MKKIPFTLLVLLFTIGCFAQGENQAIPFTLADRDRIIRLEEKMDSKFDAIDSKFDAIDTKFDSLDKRMTQLFNFLWVLMAMFTVITATTLGFAFWDRKTANKPLKEENKKIMTILKDFSKDEPRLKEILKNASVF